MQPSIAAEARQRRREILAAARGQFTIDIERGLGGRAAHARFSDRTDDLVRGLVDGALTGRPVAAMVAAIGGYGRRLLSLHSDIDLLIVFDGDVGPAEEQFLKDVLHPLWDLGLTVGPQVRTLDDARAVDLDDPAFLLAQADARFLAGQASILERIDRRAPGLTGAVKQQVIEAVLRLTRERHAAHNDTIYQLEPDVKEAPGGLRDMAAARLLTALAVEPVALDEDALEQAENFALRIRGVLHLVAGRNANVLSHDMQEQVAERLHVPGADATQRVEALMSRYFAHARSVARALDAAVSQALPSQPTPAVTVAANVELRRGMVRFVDPAAAAIAPASWLGLFEAALEHHADVAADTLDLLDSRGRRYHRADILPTADARRRLLQLLRPRRGLYATLTAMHDCRLLERLVTGFRRIRGRMIRDFYHKHTVDEHTLLAIRAIERLLAPTAARTRFAGLLAEIPAPERLVLALLLHDVGKWKEEHHAEESARMAQAVFADLDLEPDARADVTFLIAQHLELSRLTFRRDHSDARLVREFAEMVGSEARLQMLCLLTLADIEAVGPGTLTPWKEDLLWDVYVRVYTALTHGYGDSTIGPGEAAVAALTAGRPEDLGADELSRVLEGFPRRYLTTTEPARIYRHVRLARDIGRDDVRLLLDRRGDTWEIAVVALDKPQLFANICGVLAYCGMDILRGSAMTSRAGLVVDVLQFTDAEQFFARNPDAPARFEVLLRDVVAGREDIAPRLRRKEHGLRHRRVPMRLTPVIAVDNEQSPTYTVLELVAQDAPGLLHRVGRVLAGHACEVDLVLISTEGARAIDVFHLTHAGARLDASRCQAIEADLRRLWLDGAA